MPRAAHALSPGLDAQLRRRLETALRRARAHGRPVLATLTVPAPAGSDPTALALAARRAGEPWFCLEQPERQGMALAAVGAVLELRAEGPGRFTTIARRWREIVAGAVGDSVDGPPGTGLVA